ncbi:MAG: histidine phosphatase family protein [Campylobacterales bacterium]|nr:histidine phosphatase family protein [Campylobacterales bacterium]
MKTIVLIRHAKSSWKDITLDDFSRPLNKRGKQNLPVMAEHLKNQNLAIEKIFSSSAKRAKKTAEEFSTQLGVSMQLDDSLYMASDMELLNFINDKLSKYNSIAIVSHNPGLTDLYNYISDDNIENIPTSGYVVLTNNKAKISQNSTQLIDFAYPKREDI